MATGVHPGLITDLAADGIGGNLHYEAASGSLAWQRAEARAVGRRTIGSLTLGARTDLGAVAGATIPPQQLFELGGLGTLPSYGYKEFAGDHAALVRATAIYGFPIDHRPHMIAGLFYVPALSPGIGAAVQGGWTELSTPSARLAVAGLGAAPDGGLLSRQTDGVRGSVIVGVTLFSGMLIVGPTRALESSGRWKVGIGTASIVLY